MNTLRTTVYSPESPVRHPLKLVTDILTDIWKHRELTAILFQRDLKAQFRQSVLGYLWLIVPPLANALIWYLINRQKLINVDTGDVPYPQFVLVGSTLWAAFAATVGAPSESIFQNREVFVKLNVPVESFILAGTGRAVFNLIITTLTVLPFLLWQGVELSWTLALLPLCAAGLLSIAFALGMCLAPVGALYTDVRYALTPLLGILMFTAPVVYPIPQTDGLLRSVMLWNPLTPAVLASRDAILTGQTDHILPMFAWLISSMLLLLVTFVCLRVAKPHLVARMGS